MHAVASAPAVIDATQLEEAKGKKLVSAATALLVVGVLLCVAAALVDKKRFAFSYLVGFSWVVTTGLGALFFILVQHLTRAGWSVAARRHMEWIATVLPWCVVLFVPILIFRHDLFHHWMGPQAAHDELIQKKAGYLNEPFFFARAALYFLVWTLVSLFYAKMSRKQDETGDHELTLKMQAFSAPATLLFGITLTFAGFDWLMTLDPHWFSTIFGVYVFSGAAVSSLALLLIITVVLQESGYLKKVSNVEHRQDIGKLLFGFVVFWAYIAFSQYLLYWYANIPEETIYFRHRWEGSWKAVSLILLFGHFVVPFLFLLSRHTKRNPTTALVGAAFMLIMHYVDLYWLVMPTLDHHGAHPSWIDLAGLLGPLGLLAFHVAKKAADGPLYPLKDPRLAETKKVENL
ncbi:MAG: hypothetical protein HY698_12375 [Deltaproteobacteria bacterium]|nr:hypothetical protein [Deltaproteobacteria bacterium]